ncbi:hypothetical protein GCM10011575_28250 [Microlunatus endophyticus]|uniref:DUF6457 domain-containing protein n=2 Tax=Microlunatus endophyticus TaxID=1716077 RepID=A0A917W4V3_9ACTN|nr:hypothetical protein GCM10011575_28250 [Microlunatus endophyticus]
MALMELEAWLRKLAEELGIFDLTLDDDGVHTVLDLARDAAHEVQRPAAPLTSFLVGVAVGRGQSLGSAAAKATSLVLGEA